MGHNGYGGIGEGVEWESVRREVEEVGVGGRKDWGRRAA